MACMQCRRFANRHRCGAIADRAACMLMYGVDQCNACNPATPQGELSEGPKPFEGEPPCDPPPEPKPQRMPRARAADALSPKQLARRKAARKMLILLAVQEGFNTRAKVERALTRYHDRIDRVRASDHTIHDDLEDMVITGWLLKTKEDRGACDGWRSRFRWVYRVNTQIAAMMRPDESESDDDGE